MDKPRGVKVCLFHQYLQLPEITIVPAGVAVEQVVFLIDWEMAITTICVVDGEMEE